MLPTLPPGERVLLAGGYLNALLPSGELAAVVEPAGAADILSLVTHPLQRASGTLRIESLVINLRVTPAFATDVAALERRARCDAPDAALHAEPAVVAPEGFAVVAYFPDETCYRHPLRPASS